MLKDLGIDSKNMLENKRAQLNETNCSTAVRHSISPSTVSRVLIAIIKGVNNNETTNNQNGEDETINHSDSIHQRARSNYYVNKADAEPFPNPTLLDLVDRNQDAKVHAVFDGILTDFSVQGFPKAHFYELRKIFMSGLGVFRTDFSKSSAAIHHYDCN